MIADKSYHKWPWFKGFSTWGFDGAVITQLHRGDRRYGSHICHGCKKSAGCSGQGGCHTQVFCRNLDRNRFCGNGKKEVSKGESCDDGNRGAGDGCSSTCKYEKGFTCVTRRFLTKCKDIDECANPQNECRQNNMLCHNTAGSFLCHCEGGKVREGSKCVPCSPSHRKAGKCWDGSSCRDILLRKPKSANGVYKIATTPVSEPINVVCDMNAGGRTLVYKIAGSSRMMSTEAFDTDLFGHAKQSALESELSGKLSDTNIRSLCSEQYKVEQYGVLDKVQGKWVPHRPLYCRFDDIDAYADDKRNTGKRCSQTFSAEAFYPRRAVEHAWSSGFSTWGQVGSTILQLHRGDGRWGSHICYGCKATDSKCKGGGCRSRVWCLPTMPLTKVSVFSILCYSCSYLNS